MASFRTEEMNPQISQMVADSRDQQTHAIIGAAMEVHRQLGPGFLEAVYQQSLAIEFSARTIPFAPEVELPVYYKGERLNCSYSADFVCYNVVIVQLKVLKAITGVEEAQLLNYLKATGLGPGLLLNFGCPRLEFKRFVFTHLRTSAQSEDQNLTKHTIPRKVEFLRNKDKRTKVLKECNEARRGPNGNTNTFARESHMDALAEAAGVDPLEFRLTHLKDKRMLRVLDATANAFGWSSAPAPSAKGQGMACVIYKGTYVAAMGELEVDEATGRCQVKRVVCVQDMGQVINPEGAKMQMEGCVMMGLGYALTESMHFRNGEILDVNFDTYEIPKFSWMPKIETILIDNPDVAPQEGGEPAITPMGALVANGIFDATGARLYDLPMRPERVKEALKR